MNKQTVKLVQILISILTAFLLFSCNKKSFNKTPNPPILFEAGCCKIKLLYDIEKDTKCIFSSDSTVALDVIEVIADGNTLAMDKETPFNVSTCPIKIIKDFSKDDCYMTLYLQGLQNDKYYLWNDGRGILYYKGDNEIFYPYKNSYVIPKNINELVIRYRVLLPDPNINYSFLHKIKNETGKYTKTYTAKIYWRDLTVTVTEE